MKSTDNTKINKKGFRLSTVQLTQMALLAALLCAAAYITIPLGFTPVSLTLQTLIVNLTAILLTPFESLLTVLVYILLGAVGLPVFSGGQGGLGKLFGPTGGYILAFLIAAPLMSFVGKYFVMLFKKFIKNDATAKIVAYTLNAVLVGMTTVYLLGTIYMKLMMNIGWIETLTMAVVPFIPLDLAKCVAASVIGVPLKKAIAKIGR